MSTGRSAPVAPPLFALAACLAIGCASRADDVAAPVDAPERFSRSGSRAAPDRWWTAFGDPELDRLVEEALRSNLDLETAWWRLREAQAIASRESSSLLPELDASAEGQVRHPERDFDAGEDLWLGLTASYEVDLWGRIRSSVEAERLRARASLADYRTVALSISAEVTRTWYQLIEARGQVELLERQIEANAKVLRLLESRFGSGQIRSVDILRQRQLLESTRAQKLAAEADREVLRHQLAVLLGRPPRPGVRASRERLPELPPLPGTGVPGELVRRRPDVQRAYDLLLAADRDMAAAISNRYPRLSLSASLATAGSASQLFEGWFVSLAANLLAPLFDGGERRAEVDRTRAVKRQRLYEYGQTTLVAFREVEDALVKEAKQIERIESLEAQSRMARLAYAQLRIEYFNGVSEYIDVLTALTEDQQLRRDLLAARRSLLEFRVALYRALAGGFETEREAR